jgi:DNA-binding CsgD family transcriptional regulator
VLFGRDREREQIGALLAGARGSRSAALVLRGEPGVGKSALLADARSRADGMHVLGARGVESESELPFAALHQLLRPALDRIDQLPALQAGALRGALGLAEGSGEERFLVFAACLSLLSELAEERPVLCLVDDAHWLDDASADALRFVARRIEAEGIVLLLAARDGDVRGFDPAGLPALQLGGLDAAAAAELLTRSAGVATDPKVVDLLLSQTRGNALALMEMPAGLTTAQLSGDEPLPDSLPLTRQVESVFLDRVDRLPADSQLLLLVAAADDSEDAALVARAGAGLGLAADAFEPAERAGLLTVRRNRLEFRHPLVRSAIYGAATSGQVRRVHRALAEVLAADQEHADRRAWHLAASALEPDEAIVRALDEAAERARQRGGHSAAARAYERAADLSADDQQRGRRLASAASSASTAGADARAVALARRALRIVDEPGVRAQLHFALGMAELRLGRPRDSFALFAEGAREVGPTDPAAAFELLMWATWSAWQGGDLAGQLEASRLAAELGPPDGPSVGIADLLAGLAAMLQGEFTKGAGLLQPALERGFGSEVSWHVFRTSVGAFWLGDDERLEGLLARSAALARAKGEMGLLAEVLGLQASQHNLGQQYDQAILTATEGLQLARELGAENLELMPRVNLAFVAAVRGRIDEARPEAERVLEQASARALPYASATAVWVLGLTEFVQGRWTEALERLRTLVDPAAGVVAERFLATMSAPDRLEAAVRAGRPEEAHAALELFEAWATDTGPAWAQPRLASCRALLADGDAASEHFEHALGLAADARRLDLARIQFLYGEHLRRERRTIDARSHLRAAIEGFELFRAEPWADRARAELRASGVTARKREPGTLTQLTPQELQISRLVAEGLPNKEIAVHMYLSKRTIDYHLRNIYAKLGITSRSQLAGLQLQS